MAPPELVRLGRKAQESSLDRGELEGPPKHSQGADRAGAQRRVLGYQMDVWEWSASRSAGTRGQ